MVSASPRKPSSLSSKAQAGIVKGVGAALGVYRRAAAGCAAEGAEAYGAVQFLGNAADPAVLRHVRDVRDDGDRRSAGDRKCRTDVAVVGPDCRCAHARRHPQPGGQRREPDFLGLGV